MNDQNKPSLTTPNPFLVPPLNPRIDRSWKDYEFLPEDFPRPGLPDWGDIPKDYRRIIDQNPGRKDWPTATATNTAQPVSLPQPQKGERWYVKDTTNQVLVEVHVLDVTPRTIKIRLGYPRPNVNITLVDGRYEKGFLRFIEKVADAESSEQE